MRSGFRTRVTRFSSRALVVAAVVGTLLSVEQQAEAGASVAPPKPQTVPLVPTSVIHLSQPGALPTPPTTQVDEQWPAASTRTITVGALTTGAASGAAGLVAVSAAVSGAARGASFEVAVQSHDAAARLGLTGVVMRVSRRTTSSAAVQVSLDYSSFQHAAGAGFGSRLEFVMLPACSLTTPELARCRVATPVQSDNRTAQRTLVVRLNSGANAAPSTPTTGRATAAALAPGAGAFTVLAAAADPSGPGGTYTASSLAPSGSWSESGASGSFSWNYPLAMPPAAAGADVAPSIALTYNSGGVDGRIASTNNQTSLFGEGWDYTPGYIERTYRTCSDDTTLPAASKTPDLCWAGQILTLNLGGTTTALVEDDAHPDVWRSEKDDGSQIVLHNAGTGAYQNEYWTVTTSKGITYTFGLPTLPGGTAAQATNSAWTVPVHGSHTSDPCWTSTSFAATMCSQAWRWNLDLAEDPRGNATAYYYKPETGYYGANSPSTTPVAYTRGGYLDHIDYGLHDASGSIYGTAPSDRVSFTASERCNPTDASGTITCDDAHFTSTYAGHWPDTPQDQDCASSGVCNNHAPTFWTRKRVSRITTTVHSDAGSTFTPVDRYDFAQDFPTDGDDSMELQSITRTAAPNSTDKITETTTFHGTLMDNRVHNYNAQADMAEHRLTQIDTDTGMRIVVSYSQPGRSAPACTATSVPTSPDQDTSECFPVHWTPYANPTPILDYFHKYVVTQVDEVDTAGVASAPTRTTTYTYKGTPAWHYDDNEVVKPADRTWGQFRGYQKVETRTGVLGNSSYGEDTGPADQQTLEVSTYLRGMDGDRLSDGSKRTVPLVTDSRGGSWTDDDRFADTVLEDRTFLGDTSTELSTTITSYTVVATTATRTRVAAGLAPLSASIVQPLTQTHYTDVASGSAMWAKTSYDYDSAGRPVHTARTGKAVTATCTIAKYADNTTTGVHAAAYDQIVATGACPTGTADPNPTAIVSEMKTTYDNGAWGTVSRGEPTETDTLTDGASHHYATSTSSYDSWGRVVDTTVDPGDGSGIRVTERAYTQSAGGSLASVATTVGLGTSVAETSTIYLESTRGLQVASVDAAGLRTDADYDVLGELVAVWKPGQVKGTDPATATYAYLRRTDGPLAVTTSTLVDPGVDANGNAKPEVYTTSVSLYDQFGGLRQTQTDAGDGSGNRVVSDQFVDSHGWTVRTYDRYVTSGAPSTTLISVSRTGVDSRSVTAFDGAGRPVTQDAYHGATKTWTTSTVYGGDRTTVIPPDGGVETTSVTNANGSIVELDRWTVAPTINGNVLQGGSAVKTTYGYTPTGLQQSITSSSSTSLARTWTTAFDASGRPTQRTDPNTGTSSTTYDDANDVTSVTDATGRVVRFSYDALGRKTAEYAGAAVPANKIASWTYDSLMVGEPTASNRITAQGTFTTSTVGYTASGDPTGTRVKIPTSVTGLDGTYTTSYTWSSTHLMLTQRPAAGGGLPAETIKYYYDNQGHPVTTTGFNAYVSSTAWDAYSEPTQYTLGVNNQRAFISLDRDAQTRLITASTLSTMQATPQVEHDQYAYDAAGNVTSRTEQQGGGATPPTERNCYSYDHLDELVQAWSASGDDCSGDPSTETTAAAQLADIAGPQPYWSTWTYDSNGSRLTQNLHGVAAGQQDASTAYTNGAPTAANALQSRTTTTGSVQSTTGYTYNPDGTTNTVTTDTSPTTTYGYDAEGRTSSTTTGSAQSTWTYDASGNILVKTTPAETTLYLPGEELTRDAASGAVVGTRFYIHNGVTVSTRSGSDNVTYLYADLEGTGEVALATTGTSYGAVTRRHLDPFGNLVRGTANVVWPTAHGFLGAAQDSPSGIVDMGVREYDPVTGRFLSVDPVTDARTPQQLNGYSYGWQNPMRNPDPTGAEPRNPGQCFADDDTCNQHPGVGLSSAPGGGDIGHGYPWGHSYEHNDTVSGCDSDASCTQHLGHSHPPPPVEVPTSDTGIYQWWSNMCGGDDVCVTKQGQKSCFAVTGDQDCYGYNAYDAALTVSQRLFHNADSTGSSWGSKGTWAAVIGAVGTVVGVVGIVLTFTGVGTPAGAALDGAAAGIEAGSAALDAAAAGAEGAAAGGLSAADVAEGTSIALGIVAGGLDCSDGLSKSCALDAATVLVGGSGAGIKAGLKVLAPTLEDGGKIARSLAAATREVTGPYGTTMSAVDQLDVVFGINAAGTGTVGTAYGALGE